MRFIASLLPLALLCAACGPPVPAATSSSSGGAAEPAPPVAHLAPPSASELGGFATSSNALAFDLYGKIRAQSGNLALSPISVASALTMAWGGARGETAAQMKKVLHAEGEAGPSMDVAGRLLASFGGADSKVTLRVANRLFGEKTYPFEQPYLDHTRSAFGAPLEALDFRGAVEPSRVHINDWIARQTQDRIKDLIPAGGLSGDTRLVLTNAIYFLGDWASPFDKAATYPAPFHPTATASRDVPTMSQTESFRFAAIDGVKLLEMPYVGGEVAMTLVLPDAPAGLDAVEKRLSPATLDGWLGAMKSTRVNVALPKFEINPVAALSLGGILHQLGMPAAFSPDQADFTGIGKSKTPADRLFISSVFHKAFVKLDEKGTEAAAATAVAMDTASAMLPEPTEFKADHPFLFVLRHVKSGAILFMGRVSDPSAK